MQLLDLTGNPMVSEVTEMLRDMTRAETSASVLSAFLSRYSRLRPAEFFVGVMPAEGGYRIVHMRHTHEAGSTHVEYDPDPERLSRLPIRSGGLIDQLIATPGPKFVHGLDLSDDPVLCAVPPQLKMCLALPVYEHGAIARWALVFGVDGGAISPVEVAQAMVTANLLGVAGRNLDALEMIRRLNAELGQQFDAVARVQRSLLPASIPPIPGVQIATSYLPSVQAGGDWYNIVPMSGGRVAALIADVSGHGAAAATMTAMLHSMGRAFQVLRGGGDVEPRAFFEFANERLVEFGLEGNFVTAYVTIIDTSSGDVEAFNCGHPPPRIRSDRAVRGLEGSAAMPLGILHPLELEPFRTRLAPGETLILYTDGITESFGPDGDMFGTEGLEAAAARSDGSPDSVVRAICESVLAHRGNPTRDDDQTIVALRYTGPREQA